VFLDGFGFNNDPNNFAAFLNPTTNPGLFDISGFTQSVLINEPVGQVEAAFATLPSSDIGHSTYSGANDLLGGFAFSGFDPSPLDMLGMPGMSYDLYSPTESVPPSAVSESNYFAYNHGVDQSSPFVPQEQSPVDQIQLDQMLQYVNLTDDVATNDQIAEDQQQLFMGYMNQYQAGAPAPEHHQPRPPLEHANSSYAPVPPQSFLQGFVSQVHQQSAHTTASPAPMTQATSYAPLTGASKVGARRVAASWKQTFAVQQSPVVGAPSDAQLSWSTQVQS
jgi:hypothetical protein